MFVVNFDFSDHNFFTKLIAINIPVFLTEAATYPFQRLQTLLISQPGYITKSQSKEIGLILRNMLNIEGFPKLFHGMRYTVDYMGTQMTTKFVFFDLLLSISSKTINQLQKWKIVTFCILSNAFSTIASQIAFNYQTISSSLPIDKGNRPEDVKIKLQNYTKVNKLPINGIKYTLPISLFNTGLQLLILNNIAQIISIKSNLSYTFVDFLTAICVFSTTSFTLHYAFQRQVQICKGLPQRSLKYSKGLLGSLIRYNLKGLALFTLYFSYFEWKVKKQIQGLYVKRTVNDIPQAYRK